MKRLPAAIADSRRVWRPRQITWTTGRSLSGCLIALFCCCPPWFPVDQTSRLRRRSCCVGGGSCGGPPVAQETPVVEKPPAPRWSDRMMFRVYSAPPPRRCDFRDGRAQSAGWVTYFEGACFLLMDGFRSVFGVTDGRDTKLGSAARGSL